MGNLNRQVTHYSQPPMKHPLGVSDSDPTRESVGRVARELADRFTEVVPANGGTDKVACYFAREAGTGQPVRLKVLSRDVPLSTQLIDLFLLEAATASQLEHRNIAHAREPEVTNGFYLAVSERRQGVESLRSRLDWNGWLEPGEVAQIGMQIARALDYAHDCGILHLRLQPEQILVDGHGTVLVTDFGVPATLHREWSLREWVHHPSASYLSPEQLRGVAVDHRSDLYALGAILYEMLADRVPFDSRDEDDLRRRHKRGRPLALDLIVPGVAIEFAAAVMRLLTMDVDKRFASVSEFVAQAHAFFESEVDLEVPETATPNAESRNSIAIQANSALPHHVPAFRETESRIIINSPITELPRLDCVTDVATETQTPFIDRSLETAVVATSKQEPAAVQSPIRDDATDTKPIAPSPRITAVVSPQLGPVTSLSLNELAPPMRDEAGDTERILPEPSFAEVVLPTSDRRVPQSQNEFTPQMSAGTAGDKPIAVLDSVAPKASHLPAPVARLGSEFLRSQKKTPWSQRMFQITSQMERAKGSLLLDRRVIALSAVLVLVVSLLALPRQIGIKRAAELAPTELAPALVSDSTATSSPSLPESPTLASVAIVAPVFGRPADSDSDRAVSESKPSPTPTPIQETPVLPVQTTRLPQVTPVGVPLPNKSAAMLLGPSEGRRGELPPLPPPTRNEPRTEAVPPKEEVNPETPRINAAPAPNLVLGAVKSRVLPRYPSVARQAGMTGTVVVRVDVDERGTVHSARALTGPPLLRTEAEYAARSWKFEPSYLDGKPTVVTRTLSFDFKN